jgi:hypothetical protein
MFFIFPYRSTRCERDVLFGALSTARGTHYNLSVKNKASIGLQAYFVTNCWTSTDDRPFPEETYAGTVIAQFTKA